MTSSVLPFVSAAMLRWILSSFSGSVNAVASSRITMGAFLSIMRAMAMRCFSPPERRLPASPAGVSPCGSFSMNSSHCAAPPRPDLLVRRARIAEADVFKQRTVEEEIILRNKADVFRELRERHILTFTPPTVISPELTSQNRAMSFATVDLPPPDGPTSAVKLPSGSVKSMPCSTSSFSSPV